jgi:hypothetical protein
MLFNFFLLDIKEKSKQFLLRKKGGRQVRNPSAPNRRWIVAPGGRRKRFHLVIRRGNYNRKNSSSRKKNLKKKNETHLHSVLFKPKLNGLLILSLMMINGQFLARELAHRLLLWKGFLFVDKLICIQTCQFWLFPFFFLKQTTHPLLPFVQVLSIKQ